MLIEDWDIKIANARQQRVTYGNNSISNSSEWTKGSYTPVLLGNTIGFKTIKTVLVVKGAGREEIIRNKSLILSKCLHPVLLTLDNYQNKFYAVLKKSDTEEKVMNRWHLLTLEWNCYECGDRIIQTYVNEQTITIDNPGNITTPVIISIVPQIGTAALTLTGLTRNGLMNEGYEIIVRNTEVNKEIILDGENGLITEGGNLKAGEVEIWELPSLKPGENTITVDSNIKLTLSFLPRYL